MLIYFSIANWARPWFKHGFGLCQPSQDTFGILSLLELRNLSQVIHWGQTRGHVLLMGMACDVRQSGLIFIQVHSATCRVYTQCTVWLAGGKLGSRAFISHTHILSTRPRHAGDVIQGLRERKWCSCVMWSTKDYHQAWKLSSPPCSPVLAYSRLVCASGRLLCAAGQADGVLSVWIRWLWAGRGACAWTW